MLQSKKRNEALEKTQRALIQGLSQGEQREGELKKELGDRQEQLVYVSDTLKELEVRYEKKCMEVQEQQRGQLAAIDQLEATHATRIGQLNSMLTEQTRQKQSTVRFLEAKLEHSQEQLQAATTGLEVFMFHRVFFSFSC